MLTDGLTSVPDAHNSERQDKPFSSFSLPQVQQF